MISYRQRSADHRVGTRRFPGKRISWQGIFLLTLVASIWAQQSTVPLAITTESVPRLLLRQPYQAQLQASGGVPPLQWSVSRGHLPDGLNLDKSSGLISGIPAQKEEASFTVAVTDSNRQTASREYKLKVVPALTMNWAQYPQVEGAQINGSVKVSNGTDDAFDVTAIIVAVNEFGKAFALGYQRFDMKPESADVEIKFGASLPRGTYTVHTDAVAEVEAKHAIYRDRKQTPDALVVSSPR